MYVHQVTQLLNMKNIDDLNVSLNSQKLYHLNWTTIFFFFYIKTTKTNFTKLLCLKPTQNKTYLSLRKNIFCDLKYE